MGSEHLIIHGLSNDIFQSNCYEGQCQIPLKISEKVYPFYKRVDSHASVYGTCRSQWELVQKTWLFTSWNSRDKQIIFDSSVNFVAVVIACTHLQKENNFLRHQIFFFFCCAWPGCFYLVNKYACFFFLRILFECDFTERLIKLLQLIQRVRSFFLEFVSLLYRYYINLAHRTHLLCKKIVDW